MVDYTQEVIEAHEEPNAQEAQKTGGLNMMTEQAKAARRAYRAEWNRKNRDKVKAQQERYWEKRAAQMAQEAQQAQPAPDAGETQEKNDL